MKTSNLKKKKNMYINVYIFKYDVEVRKAAQQVDIILKDIVCEALPDKNQI